MDVVRPAALSFRFIFHSSFHNSFHKFLFVLGIVCVCCVGVLWMETLRELYEFVVLWMMIGLQFQFQCQYSFRFQFEFEFQFQWILCVEIAEMQNKMDVKKK